MFLENVTSQAKAQFNIWTCLICALETDQHAHNEGEHEDWKPPCQHEEKQSSANYSM